MNVWLIRLSMAVTLDGAGVARFSKCALSLWSLTGRARPRHRPARRHAQGRAVAGEARPVRRRRLADDRAERAAEGAEAVEADVEADLGHRPVRLAQELHRPLDAATLQVAVRGLPERRAELAAEVRGRDMRRAGERRDVERLRERPVHRVAAPQHSAASVPDGARHRARWVWRGLCSPVRRARTRAQRGLWWRA